MIGELRLALRSLRRSPAVTLAAILTLALGIGATTAIFTVVDGVLLRPLPYPHPDRLVMIWETSPRGNDHNVVSVANFLDWRDGSRAFSQMAIFAPTAMSLTGRGDPRQLDGFIASPALFDTLQVRAERGRTFEPDDGPDRPAVAVISHRLWQQLGSDPAIVGHTLALGGTPTTVIGVLPAGFTLVDRTSDFFVPIHLGEEYRVRHGRGATAIARLKDGVTLARARTELATIAARLARQYPDFDKGWGVNVVPLGQDLVGPVRPALLVLLAAVALVLLIACANVANLLLARATVRRRELALRAALGAGRGRLIRQLLVESLVLAGLGGSAGLLGGAWLLKMLLGVAAGRIPIPRLAEVHLDPWVAVFALGLSLVTGLLFGLAPASSIWHLEWQDALKDAGRGVSTGGRRSRQALVIAEVSLALVLLTGTGLMLRSFERLTAVDPGFRTDHVLTMRAVLPAGTYRTDEQRTAFFDRAVAGLAALPDVRSASAVTFVPLSGPGSATTFFVNDRPQPAPGEWPADIRAVAPGYFTTMGIPLLRGRDFSSHDKAGSPDVAIVNETLARRFWPGQDPIGRRVTYSWGSLKTLEVVGVVGDARLVTLSDDEIRPAIYRPQWQQPSSAMTFVVRTAGEPSALAGSAQAAIRALDPDLPLSDVEPLDAVLSNALARPRLIALLLAFFGVSALLLAAIGIYGVMAYAVARRRQEIGVRVALGASRARVMGLVVGQAMRLTAFGILIGVGAAFALTRLLASLLYGVTATDAATFVAVPVLLAVVAAAASLLPARRATAVDPTTAVRSE